MSRVEGTLRLKTAEFAPTTWKVTAPPAEASKVMVLKPIEVLLPNAKFGVPLPTICSTTEVMALPLIVKLPFCQRPRPPRRFETAVVRLSKINVAVGAMVLAVPTPLLNMALPAKVTVPPLMVRPNAPMLS